MNSWNIDVTELPSRGQDYPADTYVKIHPMTVGNCKYLCTLNPDEPIKATRMLNEVLESCIDTNLEFSKMAWADRNYLLFWLRVNSFIQSNGYELSIDCPYCGQKINKRLKLDNLEVKYADECNFMNEKIQIGDTEIVVCSNVPLIGEEKFIAEDKIIEDILNFTNIREFIPATADPVWFISKLDAMNFIVLKNIAENSKFGLEGIINIHCDFCNTKMPVDVDLSDTNMFGRLSLYEILKVQVQVSKYCGFQVSDDLSYTDVELMQEVIKNLIEEEKAEAEKQKGNFTLSKPNINMPKFHK